MKLIVCAGPPTSGKTTVLKHMVRKLIKSNYKLSYLKIDVVYADEDELFKEEFGIPTHKVYSDDLCPDHCSVMVLGEAVEWAEKNGSDFLFVETAGLCLRCAPYVEGCLGMVVLEATSGMSLPKKIGPMLTLADIAVVTKIDLISQAEREVFRANILEVSSKVCIIETDALHGINIDYLVSYAKNSPNISKPMFLRGCPPVGTCTICVGKKQIGWKEHFGVVRPLKIDAFYRGE
jgi:Ni2+-binding GTPase involved in maturation of urease and hydrogenase